MNKNIILCGFMGSGKTVTGKALAIKTNMEFIDIDLFIEREQKMSVSNIFEKYGEAHFRKLETDAVKYLSSLSGKIIACGGGTVLNSENVAALKSGGKIYYLSVTPEMIEARLKNDKSRPLLANDKHNTLIKLFNQRLPIYTSVADHIIMADGTIEHTVAEILKTITD